MNNTFLKTTTALCRLILLSSISSADPQPVLPGEVLLPIAEVVSNKKPVRTGVSTGVSKVTKTITDKKTAIEGDKTTLENNKHTTETTNSDGSITKEVQTTGANVKIKATETTSVDGTTVTKGGITMKNGNQITKTVNGKVTTVDVSRDGNNLNIVGVNNGDGTTAITVDNDGQKQSGTVDYTSSNRPFGGR